MFTFPTLLKRFAGQLKPCAFVSLTFTVDCFWAWNHGSSRIARQSCSLQTGLTLKTRVLRGFVRDELHDYRKCYTMENGKLLLSSEGERIALEPPRWRSILIQATVDHIDEAKIRKLLIKGLKHEPDWAVAFQVIPLLVVFHSQKLYTKATGLLQPAANVPGSGGGERPAGEFITTFVQENLPNSINTEWAQKVIHGKDKKEKKEKDKDKSKKDKKEKKKDRSRHGLCRAQQKMLPCILQRRIHWRRPSAHEQLDEILASDILKDVGKEDQKDMDAAQKTHGRMAKVLEAAILTRTSGPLPLDGVIIVPA
ncbi:unnamed protein product [Symbiodinium sp. KB8]|nr:unnamed protein product [Symbiodinium sp. KB8]